MKILMTTAAALAALALSVPANAADLAARPYTKAPAFVPAPIYNWTGFYIGANAGYGFSDRDTITTTGQLQANINNVNGGARPGAVNLSRDGFVGGGQIGYNWQTGPNWVFGLEADIQYTDLNRSVSVVTVPLNGIGTLNNTFSSRMEYFGTVRGRLGYTWGATMLYGTGGFAYGEVENTASFSGNNFNVVQFTGRNKDIRTGYTVGGGIEHMFTPNWSVKAEYLYYDLGSSNVNVAFVPGNGGAITGYDSRFRNDGHIVRAGLNYKFGGPVVARY